MIDLSESWPGGILSERRQRYDFIKLAIEKFDRDLNAGNGVVARKIDRALGVLEIQRFKRVGRPFLRSLDVELATDVLEQDFHNNDRIPLPIGASVPPLPSGVNRMTRILVHPLPAAILICAG